MKGRQKRSERDYQKKLERAVRKEKVKNNKEVEKLYAYPLNFSSEAQRIPHLQSLMEKHIDGEELTPKEITYMCGSIDRSTRHQFDVCDDARFYNLYLDHFQVRNNLRAVNNGSYPPGFIERENRRMYSAQATDNRNLALNDFHDTWKARIVDNTQNNDKVYMEIRKETRKMINQIQANNTLSTDEKEAAEREIILRSKAIYFKIKQTLQNLNQDIYDLELCGEEVHIDTFSLTHVMFRHYSEMTKPFEDNKSYFTPELPNELILPKLHTILQKIEDSGLLGDDLPQSIFFEHLGRLYRIYFKEVTKSKAGRGMYTVQRVNTFYPVEMSKDLNDAKQLTARNVEPFLKVYT